MEVAITVVAPELENTIEFSVLLYGFGTNPPIKEIELSLKERFIMPTRDFKSLLPLDKVVSRPVLDLPAFQDLNLKSFLCLIIIELLNV